MPSFSFSVSLPVWDGDRAETVRVNRRAFLIGAGAVLLAGCAKSEPVVSSSASPSAGPSASASVAPTIAAENSATGALLGALLAGAGAKAGSAATVVAAGDDWLDALGAGRVAAVPIWAMTVWGQLSDDEEPPADVLSDLAGLVGDSVRVLTPGPTDGGLVWMAARGAPVTSLDELGRFGAGKKAAVAALAVDRSDGMGALNAIYRTNFSALVQDDPLLRAQAVAGGQAAIGAFRKTENVGDAAVSALADPDKVCSPDQLVLAVNASFAEQRPQATLALNAVIQALNNDQLIDLQRQVIAQNSVDTVAAAWLTAHGLG